MIEHLDLGTGSSNEDGKSSWMKSIAKALITGAGRRVHGRIDNGDSFSNANFGTINVLSASGMVRQKPIRVAMAYSSILRQCRDPMHFKLYFLLQSFSPSYLSFKNKPICIAVVQPKLVSHY